jgi:hypothetical protein
MNAQGAARIKFGQYTAWKVGIHHTHEALVQTGGKVTVYRDYNQDYKRDGDREDTGFFGVNQHWGYDLPKNDLGRSSAGCLVGRTTKGHKEFMALLKTDPRWREDFVWTATVLDGKEVLDMPKQSLAPEGEKRSLGIRGIHYVTGIVSGVLAYGYSSVTDHRLAYLACFCLASLAFLLYKRLTKTIGRDTPKDSVPENKPGSDNPTPPPVLSDKPVAEDKQPEGDKQQGGKEDDLPK